MNFNWKKAFHDWALHCARKKIRPMTALSFAQWLAEYVEITEKQWVGLTRQANVTATDQRINLYLEE